MKKLKILLLLLFFLFCFSCDKLEVISRQLTQKENTPKTDTGVVDPIIDEALVVWYKIDEGLGSQVGESSENLQAPTGLRVIETDEIADHYTYYVQANIGNDLHPGSKEQPFRTIQRSADIARPGDRILIRAGVYKEFITMKASGKEGNRIIFQGERGSNGEYLAIIDPSVPAGGWEPAPEVGIGVYKAKLGFDPTEMTVDGMRIGRLSNTRMGGTSGIYGTGFQMLDINDNYLVEWPRDSGKYEFFWDGLEVLYGYHNGTTFIRFRNRQENPNNKLIKAATSGWAINITNVAYISVKDIKIQGAQKSILMSGSGCHNIIIEDSYLSNGNERVGIQLNAHSNIIKNNVVTMNYIASDYLGPAYGRIYEFFKFQIGTGTSDDVSFRLSNPGDNNVVEGNEIFGGLIGLTASRISGSAPTNGFFISNNFFYNLCSVGITVSLGIINWQIFGNTFYNSQNKIRFHSLNDPNELGREVYIYNNRFYGAGENFRFWGQNVPHPSYFGKYFVYHNSFSGGWIGYDSNVTNSGGMPNFHFFNNIWSGHLVSNNFNTAIKEGELGLIGPNWIGGNVGNNDSLLIATFQTDGCIVKHNVYMWASMPDWFDYSADRVVENGGIDLSQPFISNNNQVLPGMKEAYAGKSKPPLGVIQH